MQRAKGRFLPAPQFHQDRAGWNSLRDGISIRAQHLDLSIGEIIFLQICDLFEYLQPCFVVKEKGWHLLLPSRAWTKLIKYLLAQRWPNTASSDVYDLASTVMTVDTRFRSSPVRALHIRLTGSKGTGSFAARVVHFRYVDDNADVCQRPGN